MRFSHRTQILSILVSCCLYLSAQAAVELKDIQEQLPNGQLDIPTVIGLGAIYSQSFKAVQAQGALIETARLDAEANFVPKISLRATHTDSQADVLLNTFSPTESESMIYDFSFNKYFTTGTAFEVTYSQSEFDSEYVSSSPFSALEHYYDSTAKVKVSQSLWKDAFGNSSRKLYKAGLSRSKAQEQQSKLEANKWYTDFTNALYLAWSAQQSAKANSETLKRRQELLKIAKINQRRGTINTKDFIQLETAALGSDIAFERAKEYIQSIWQELIIKLSLPENWSELDPLVIPIQLDNPMTEAQRVCAQPTQRSELVEQLEYALQAAKLNESSSKNLAKPNLNLFAQYSANSIDNSISNVNEDITQLEHPSLSLGIELSMPLSFDKEKSDYLKAYSQRLKIESDLSGARDQHITVFKNACRELELQINNVAKLSAIVVNLRKREALEHRDFKTGRTSSFNYVQSGVDAIDAEINYIRAQVDVRQLAWSIISATQSLSPRIEKYIAEIKTSKK